MQIHKYSTIEALLDNMAAYFIATASKAIDGGGRCSVALSGGGSPKRLFALLASAAFSKQLDWTKVDCFFGDERYVPVTDAASNYKMANDVLLQPLQVPAANIFPVNTSLSPVDAAEDYNKKIKAYFKDGESSFDLVLLGLGDNAHTASLFPYTPVLHQKTAAVTAVYLEQQQVWRITLNAPLINSAKNIAFLVYGPDKAAAVRQILQQPLNIDLYPAQLIKPESGQLHWFMDDAAARFV